MVQFSQDEQVNQRVKGQESKVKGTKTVSGATRRGDGAVGV